MLWPGMKDGEDTMISVRETMFHVCRMNNRTCRVMVISTKRKAGLECSDHSKSYHSKTKLEGNQRLVKHMEGSQAVWMSQNVFLLWM